MGLVRLRSGGKTMPKGGIVLNHYGHLWDYEGVNWNGLRLPILDAMTNTKVERPDVLEIAAMRARWKEERAAGATGETFVRWRKRIRAEVIDELREVLNDDPRRWPDPRKRDLGKPERRKRPRTV
jgi:hypothetical protein